MNSLTASIGHTNNQLAEYQKYKNNPFTAEQVESIREIFPYFDIIVLYRILKYRNDVKNNDTETLSFDSFNPNDTSIKGTYLVETTTNEISLSVNNIFESYYKFQGKTIGNSQNGQLNIDGYNFLSKYIFLIEKFNLFNSKLIGTFSGTLLLYSYSKIVEYSNNEGGLFNKHFLLLSNEENLKNLFNKMRTFNFNPNMIDNKDYDVIKNVLSGKSFSESKNCFNVDIYTDLILDDIMDQALDRFQNFKVIYESANLYYDINETSLPYFDFMFFLVKCNEKYTSQKDDFPESKEYKFLVSFFEANPTFTEEEIKYFNEIITLESKILSSIVCNDRLKTQGIDFSKGFDTGLFGYLHGLNDGIVDLETIINLSGEDILKGNWKRETYIKLIDEYQDEFTDILTSGNIENHFIGNLKNIGEPIELKIENVRKIRDSFFLCKSDIDILDIKHYIKYFVDSTSNEEYSVIIDGIISCSNDDIFIGLVGELSIPRFSNNEKLLEKLFKDIISRGNINYEYLRISNINQILNYINIDLIINSFLYLNDESFCILFKEVFINKENIKGFTNKLLNDKYNSERLISNLVKNIDNINDYSLGNFASININHFLNYISFNFKEDYDKIIQKLGLKDNNALNSNKDIKYILGNVEFILESDGKEEKCNKTDYNINSLNEDLLISLINSDKLTIDDFLTEGGFKYLNLFLNTIKNKTKNDKFTSGLESEISYMDYFTKKIESEDIVIEILEGISNITEIDEELFEFLLHDFTYSYLIYRKFKNQDCKNFVKKDDYFKKLNLYYHSNSKIEEKNLLGKYILFNSDIQNEDTNKTSSREWNEVTKEPVKETDSVIEVNYNIDFETYGFGELFRNDNNLLLLELKMISLKDEEIKSSGVTDNYNVDNLYEKGIMDIVFEKEGEEFINILKEYHRILFFYDFKLLKTKIHELSLIEIKGVMSSFRGKKVKSEIISFLLVESHKKGQKSTSN